MANNKNFKVKNGIQPTVYHENVGTITSGTGVVGFDISSASYDSKSFDASSQSGQMYGMFFKPDGTKMYLIEQVGSDNFYQYSLSTAWDISTASYDSVSKQNGADGSPGGFYIKSDGLTLFMTGMASGGKVYKHTFGTAWDLSTLSYSGTSFSVNSQSAAPYDVWFKPDGTKFFVVDISGDRVYEYAMSTAWDISTASYTTSTSTFSFGNPNGIEFTSDGTKMFVCSSSNDSVNYFELDTAWDVSTARSVSSFSVQSQDTAPFKAKFKSDGTKMYVLGATNDDIYQYTTEGSIPTKTLDMSTGTVFELTPTADNRIGLSNPADSGTVSAAALIIKEPTPIGYGMSQTSFLDRTAHSLSNVFSIRFKSDGTKAYFSPYYSGAYGITEHTLSTAWDISTLNTTPSAFYNSDGSNNILDFFFKPDGTKLYTMGYSQDRVYQHSLSTAWDISTASSDSKSAYVGTQDSTPHSLYFKPDGTKFYMSGNSTVLNEYTMSTAWDVSTASYTQKSGNLTGSTQYAIAFIPDGTEVYMMGASGVLYGYTLSTAWDSTTLNTSYFLSYDAQTAASGARSYGLTFGDSGKYWYGASSSYAFQFNSYVMPSLSYDSSIKFAGGTAPTSPALGETDVLTFTTRDGGTTYNGILGIDGAK